MKANDRQFKGIILFVLAVEIGLAGLYGEHTQLDITSSLIYLKFFCGLLQLIGICLLVIAILHFIIDVSDEAKPKS